MTTKRGTLPLTRSWDDYIEERLSKDPREAIDYLNAALEDEPEVFLVALRHVVNARKRRMQDVASSAGLHRVSLHKALSKRGNPRLDTLRNVLAALNLKLRIEPKPVAKRKRKLA